MCARLGSLTYGLTLPARLELANERADARALHAQRVELTLQRLALGGLVEQVGFAWQCTEWIVRLAPTLEQPAAVIGPDERIRGAEEAPGGGVAIVLRQQVVLGIARAAEDLAGVVR